MKKKVLISRVVKPITPEVMMFRGRTLRFGPECNEHEVDVAPEELAALMSSGFAVTEVVPPKPKRAPKKAVSKSKEIEPEMKEEDDDTSVSE